MKCAYLPGVLMSLTTCLAAASGPLSSGEIRLGIRHLNTVGSVLYVAAHPDDENTTFLTWAARARGLDATYLSMTRGDGGQNLIGKEQAALFGVIRTQELMRARALDGAHQRFTRTRDFGYSLTPGESLKIWGHAEARADVLRAIRSVQPDAIVMRFSDAGGGHGHHTASALLALEAFEVAAKESWAPARILRNVSTWRLPKDADMSAYLSLPVGGYEPLLGRDLGEISAQSRSQHKSQGFGVAPRRGERTEYFEHRGGSKPPGQDPFGGLDFTWARIPGGEAIPPLIERAEKAFHPDDPARAIPALVAIHRALDRLEDTRFVPRKKAAVQRLIAACAGLFLDATTTHFHAAAGENIQVVVQWLQWHAGPTLEQVRVGGAPVRSVQSPDVGTLLDIPVDVTISRAAPVSTAYWLLQPEDGGRFTAPAERIGDPDSPPALTAEITWSVEGLKLTTTVPVTHTWTDRVHGERRRRLEVVPSVMLTPAQSVVVVPNAEAVTVPVVLTAGAKSARGVARLDAPRGWQITPTEAPFDLKKRGATETIRFRVKPPARRAKSSDGGHVLRPVAIVDGVEHRLRLDAIDYPHIPIQTVLRPAEIKAVPLRIERGRVERVGYVPGAGDEVPEALRAVGYDVVTLDEEALATGDFDGLDAIVLGVRAWNTKQWLWTHQPALLEWVHDGGTLISQYSTNSRWTTLPGDVGPYPITIGRGRVTVEQAPLKPLVPKHPAMRTPNRLGPADYDGWVQERGLYFGKTWDERYVPLFESADPDSKPERGALLVAKHGKGHFVYTGLSLFRQLPAGVPGAYRILANLLAL